MPVGADVADVAARVRVAVAVARAEDELADDAGA